MEYKCAKCGGLFEDDEPPDIAINEKEMLWGDIPMSECAIVCEDCFKDVMGQSN